MISRETELAILYEISSLSSRIRSIDAVIDAALDKVTRLLGAEIAIFYIGAGAGAAQELLARSARGIRLKRVRASIPAASIAQLGGSLQVWQGQPCPLDPLLGGIPCATTAGLSITIERELVGWVYAGWMQPHPIAPTEETLFTILSDRVGGALEVLLARERDRQQHEALLVANQQLQQLIEAEAAAREQQAALLETIREMSVPVLQITGQMLLMPLVGSIDSTRSHMLTERMLQAISAQQAQICIIDITGVPLVDTQVANILIQAAMAARLLGAHVLLCGITPEVAQVIVSLGVDLRIITTVSDLRSALTAGFRMLGRSFG